MADDRDLVGLRDEDLTPEERERRSRLLARDREAAAEHRDARRLGERLAGLGTPMGPSLERARGARDRVGESPSWGPALAIAVTVLVAAGVLLAVVASLLPRGDGLPSSVLEMTAPEPGDASFEVRVQRPGYLYVVEEGRGVVQEGAVDAPGAVDVPLGEGEGNRTFRALLCEDPDDASRAFERCATIAVPVEEAP